MESPNLEDDISLYSDIGVSQSHLSKLYELLDDDSVELRRSTSVETEQRPYMASPIKSAYAEHVGRQRSPRKKEPTSSYDTIERDIDRFLKNDVLNDGDRTELLIKETHKTVSSADTEGKYSELLSQSIDKMTKMLEQQRNTNVKQQREMERMKEHQDRLKAEKTRLEAALEESRNTISQLERKLAQKVPHTESKIMRENALLREKLIKYKKMAEKKDQKDGQNEKDKQEEKKPEGQKSGFQMNTTDGIIEASPAPGGVLQGKVLYGDDGKRYRQVRISEQTFFQEVPRESEEGRKEKEKENTYKEKENVYKEKEKENAYKKEERWNEVNERKVGERRNNEWKEEERWNEERDRKDLRNEDCRRKDGKDGKNGKNDGQGVYEKEGEKSQILTLSELLDKVRVCTRCVEVRSAPEIGTAASEGKMHELLTELVAEIHAAREMLGKVNIQNGEHNVQFRKETAGLRKEASENHEEGDKERCSVCDDTVEMMGRF